MNLDDYQESRIEPRMESRIEPRMKSRIKEDDMNYHLNLKYGRYDNIIQSKFRTDALIQKLLTDKWFIIYAQNLINGSQ